MKVMKNISLLYIGLVLLISFSCGQRQKSARNDKPVVNVSILPLKHFTEELAGDFVRINVMVPQGANPATYEPTPEHMSLLSRSDAYLGIKPLIFEKTWMPKFTSVNENMKRYNLAKGVELIHRESKSKGVEAADPHVWISPQTVEILVKNLRDALIELYPKHKEAIEANHKTLLKEIKQKDQFLKEVFHKKQEISFLIFHPALGYLARDYGLNQLIIQHQGKEPSPRELRRITEKAKTNEVSQVFIQKQFDTRNARTIADELGVGVTVINPLAENWSHEIEKIGRALAEIDK